jgi:AcrR family transcriptional regulator
MVRKTRLPNASRGSFVDGEPDASRAQRRGTGRTARGREKRELLLRAARTVFEREGFLHTRISDICDEAGISHGSFYTYFSSKEEIFQELIDDIELDILTPATSPGGADPFDRIEAANRHYLEAVRKNAAILAVIEQVVTFDEDARVTRDARETAFSAALERRTREYQDAGLADRRLDARFAASALGAMVHAVASSMFIEGRQEYEIEEATEQLTRLWTNALGMGRVSTSPDHDRSSAARGDAVAPVVQALPEPLARAGEIVHVGHPRADADGHVG